jgi:hypothetical protein
MTTRIFLLSLLALLMSRSSRAQSGIADSTAVAGTLKTLFTICRNVDFNDPGIIQSGTFYKAAPYIIYRGDDKKRNWKDFADYSKADEKIRVNEVCARINRTANQDSAYKIVKYFTEKESEGTWHVLVVSYSKKGAQKTTAYAFLKIGKKFGLGDID